MQAIELALGILPREYNGWDEVQGWHKDLLPTPTRRDHNGRGYPNATSPALPNVVIEQAKLLPTPKANDHKGATITHGRFRPDGRPYGDGDANLPLVTQELPLLPTPLSGEARHGSPGQHRTRGDKMLTGEVLNLLATPGAYDGERGGPQDPSKRRAGGHYVTLQDQAVFELLPSPMAADGDRGSLTFARGNPTLKGALLPTPSVSDGTGGHVNRSGARRDELLLNGIAQTMAVEWGVYEPAIRRWEYIRGIEAPCPVEPGQKGNMRLAPLFVEWMMGLPPGWVTGVEGLSRAKQLKLLGNGVVPLQVYYALRELLETLSLME